MFRTLAEYLATTLATTTLPLLREDAESDLTPGTHEVLATQLDTIGHTPGMREVGDSGLVVAAARAANFAHAAGDAVYAAAGAKLAAPRRSSSRLMGGRLLG